MHVYRKLVPAEIGLFHDHLLSLTPDDRHCRFSGFVSDARIADYCSSIDWFRAIIVGCFVDGVLRGVAELRLDDPRLGWRCELAVTVEREWQSRGIGTELLRRAITICRNRAIRSIYMICLVENRRMQRIARRFDGDLVFVEGEAEAQVALPFPDQFTLAREALDEGAAWMMAWVDLPARVARMA
ncbi:MAG TPA: GNAT family N-acetyltransferase [Alphaproteobacteria bacterium]|nr:GNAT family N-acetyltransferase [Alphaproteobacteria bacterium]